MFVWRCVFPSKGEAKSVISCRKSHKSAWKLVCISGWLFSPHVVRSTLNIISNFFFSSCQQIHFYLAKNQNIWLTGEVKSWMLLLLHHPEQQNIFLFSRKDCSIQPFMSMMRWKFDFICNVLHSLLICTHSSVITFTNADHANGVAALW